MVVALGCFAAPRLCQLLSGWIADRGSLLRAGGHQRAEPGRDIPHPGKRPIYSVA